MNVKEEIVKNMKKYEKMPPDTPTEGVWEWEEGALQDGAEPSFRVKTSTMSATGRLHMQFTCADIAGLHSDMKEELGTPFIQLGDNAMRGYGVAVNLAVGHGSIDESNLKNLGTKVMGDTKASVESLASKSTDYAIMDFRGVVDGIDNTGKDVKMLEFRVGSEENKMLIAFSHLEPAKKTDGMNYPELRGEWFLAWICGRYWGEDFLAQEEE